MADSAALAQNASPFMAQYLAAKAQHPDALLFFRMGDFYEMFFADAEQAAPALGIALTKRGQHQGEDIPMAGVPWRQAELYVAKLIRAGFRVAICEQMEDPAEARKRGSKAVVRREVVRVITPGTLTEEGLLDALTPNLLAAAAFTDDGVALAWADVSTGALHVRSLPVGRAADEIAALRPAELLAPEADCARPTVKDAIAACGTTLTPRPNAKADPDFGARRAQALFEVSSLDAFGDFTRAELSALGLLLDYVELTQAGDAPRLSPPRRVLSDGLMAIDPATRAALEIDRSMRGGRDGSLLGAVDRTVTAPGARLLAERLARPLTDLAAIRRRHDSVAFFLESASRRAELRRALKEAGDLARALSRLALGRGGPRDLAALRDGLKAGGAASALCAVADAPEEVTAAGAALDLWRAPELSALAADLMYALAPELPILARDGGFIAPGFDVSLDEHRALRDDSRKVIAALQAQYAEHTSIPTLKLRHNAVLGYHIEVTAKQAEAFLKPPLVNTYIHRQTTANAVRFTTSELSELDAKIARAGDAALGRELALFKAFAERALGLSGAIRTAAEALAALDVAASMAEWAEETQAVRPELDESAALIADAARHPVVEAALRRQAAGFTPNDVRLDGDGQTGARLLLLTGPNMAGKSTYLRQIALLAVLAQAGGYAPARRLRLGLVDRLFARVGASDDLARGRSTFMMEMIETAAILNQAGPRALVVLDEIGRGTATFDGLAIAWATAEHLHDSNRCRAVFATHYHELTTLPQRLDACANAHLRAKEWRGDLVFLHEVSPGAADRSYGVQVGKLAGLPKSVIERARAVLSRLESGKAKPDLSEELPLLAAVGEPSTQSAVEAALDAMDPDSMSPKEALEALYRLKGFAARG